MLDNWLISLSLYKSFVLVLIFKNQYNKQSCSFLFDFTLIIWYHSIFFALCFHIYYFSYSRPLVFRLWLFMIHTQFFFDFIMPNPISQISSSISSESAGSSDDPYYLHHYDYHGALLVNQILTRDNYASWSRSMTITLSVKNKLDFVTDNLPWPSSTEANCMKS